MIAVGQLLFVWNLVQTLRGAERRRADAPLAVAEGLVTMIAIGFAVGAGAIGFFVGRATAPEQTKTVASTAAAPAPKPSNTVLQGKQVFAKAGCGGCHTLSAAGSAGKVGPNLDQAHPAQALVVDRVEHGKGAMPSFGGQLSDDEIEAVAAFVSQSAGR
jgi:mono/diheme cytochrome c family protein